MESGLSEIETLVKEYEEGASDVEVCTSLKLPWREFEKRINNDDAFAQLVEYGRLAAKSWWLRMSRQALGDKTFNFQVWYAHMKNRYGWSDKSEVVDGSKKPIEELSREELEAVFTKVAGKKKDKIAALFSVKNTELKEEETDGSGQVH
jgi:hypothetical protein